MQAIRSSEIVLVRPTSPTSRFMWTAALAISGMMGFGCGIAGLFLSFLAAAGIVEPGSGVRLAVPIFIVISLTSFMGCAHAMDRLQSIEDHK